MRDFRASSLTLLQSLSTPLSSHRETLRILNYLPYIAQRFSSTRVLLMVRSLLPAERTRKVMSNSSRGLVRCSKFFQDASLAGLSNSPPISSNGFWLSGVEGRPDKKTQTLTEIREANAKSYQETMARAALLRAEGVDDILITSPTGENSSESFLQSCTLLEDKSKELHAAQCLKSRLLSQADLLNSECDTSFISDSRRGTSWPVLGLPKNPFLSSRNERDQSFSYTYTVFPENNGCWDVNILVHWNDTHSVPGTRVQFVIVEEDWPTSEWRFVWDEQRVHGDHSHWLKNLEDYMRKQLTSGLDEQILEVDYASFNYQFEKDDDC